MWQLLKFDHIFSLHRGLALPHSTNKIEKENLGKITIFREQRRMVDLDVDLDSGTPPRLDFQERKDCKGADDSDIRSSTMP